ncbi:MAG: NAD(P)H-dependent glycerol-3-phosphate dehydrogenase [Beijerinckiaceae bacterium]
MTTTLFQHIGIVGAGAFGSALACAAARAGRKVTLFARDPAQVHDINTKHENTKALKGCQLDPTIKATSELAAMAQCNAVILALPMQATRPVAEALALALPASVPIICTAKGIERGTLLFATDLVTDLLPGHLAAILSGPSFAIDIASGLPTAVTLACADPYLAQALAQALNTPALRIYHGTDVRGVEIGGAAKNVLAIAAGIVAGRGLGDSARAAIITRGFAEIRRFGEAFGARPETLMGLSGLGDLLLTASSPQSRNYALGLRLGGGMSIEEAVSTGKLAEGAATASALMELAKARDIDLPICGMVDALLNGWLTVDGALEALLNRPQRAE